MLIKNKYFVFASSKFEYPQKAPIYATLHITHSSMYEMQTSEKEYSNRYKAPWFIKKCTGDLISVKQF